MRRKTSLFLLLVFLVIACRALTPEAWNSPTPRITELPESPTPQLTPARPTATIPAFFPSPLPSPAPTDTPLSAEQFRLRLHPDGPLYVGDLVSLEVISTQDTGWAGRSVNVAFGLPEDTQTGETKFDRYGIGGRPQATLYWAWDTSGLPPGEHTLTFSILPDGVSWSETVQLLPQGDVPPPEPQARWARAESDCCLVYYVTGTSAQRELEALLEMLDEQAEDATQRMGANPSEPFQVTFLPRVLGHGGFAGDGISVSYLDRNYAGGSTSTVIHHEMIHILDASLGGDMRPSLFVEGLAVYQTGGHFKLEPLLPRAAALLTPASGCIAANQLLAGRVAKPEAPVCGLDRYLPLSPLLDNFYFSQHEISYLEAGALIEFMVNTWGWPAFSDFYRDIHPQPEPEEGPAESFGPVARAVNAALLTHYNLTLGQLEDRFLKALQAEALTPALAEDVRLTVAFYDTVRLYQRLLDPSAYFLTAWLPDSDEMRRRGIVADLLRRPSQPENLALEAMLVTSDAALRDGDFVATNETLQAIRAVLQAIEKGQPDPFAAQPLANDYFAVVQALLAHGYQPQRIQLAGDSVQAWVSTDGFETTILELTRSQNGWNILK